MTTKKELSKKEKDLEAKLDTLDKDSKEYETVCKELDEVRTESIILGC